MGPNMRIATKTPYDEESFFLQSFVKESVTIF